VAEAMEPVTVSAKSEKIAKVSIKMIMAVFLVCELARR
jgi:hypothetical protein